MPASEHAAPLSRRDDALAVVRKLVENGHVAYFAGGCVRDQLLGREPKDYDVATDAPPDRVRQLFPRSQGVGQAFGVVIVRIGKSQIEVATFRSDGTYSDGRRPDEVHFASPEEDARRRDFTINGLFYDPIADRVIDYVGGQDDLKAGVLRAIGDPNVRFAEDYLRMLRAVRFAARFDLQIDPETTDAIRANVHKLPRIAPERIADELRAMLTPPAPARTQALGRLIELGLSDVILRHVFEALKLADGSIRDPRMSNFERLAADRAISFALACAGWVVDAALARGTTLATVLSPDASHRIERALRQTLKLSNEESAALKTVLAIGQLLPPNAAPSVAAFKRFLAQPFADEAMQLLDALAASGHERERIGALIAEAAAFDPAQIAPPPLINGDDLQAMGFAPGPRFKRTLDAVYDAQLEARITEREQALSLARDVFSGT